MKQISLFILLGITLVGGLTSCDKTPLELPEQELSVLEGQSHINYPTLKDSFYVKEYNSQDVLIKEGWLINGVAHDYWIYRHENGQVESEGNYDKGAKTGLWKYFYSNGQLSEQGEFTNGKRSHWWKFYNTEGQLISEGEYASDMKNGYWINYDNGLPISEGKYINDVQVGTWKYFDSNGQLMKLETY